MTDLQRHRARGLWRARQRDSVIHMRVEAVNSLDKPDAAIEIPWKSPDGDSYVNLRENPGEIQKLGVAADNVPMAGFLTAVNGETSLFCTVRAKASANGANSSEPTFHSRVDLAFAQAEFNFMKERYEDAVRRLLEVWMKDFAAADALTVKLELIPCRYSGLENSGIALRLIITARGATPDQARTRWSLGLVRVQQAILFVSRAMRQKLGLNRQADAG